MQAAFHGVAGAQDVAVHVACGGDGVEAEFVQPLVHGFDVGLEDAVVLEGLAVGEADGTVEGVAAGELVDAQPLLRGNHAAGQAAAQHDVFEIVELLVVPLGADVAVVLLVHAVEADELEVVAVEAAGEAVAEVLGDGAAQVAALAFEAFVVGQGGGGEFGAGVGGSHGWVPLGLGCFGAV